MAKSPAPTEIMQPTFAGGEASPAIAGRVDLSRYYTMLRTCRNFIVRQTGGVTNRAGTTFVGEVANSAYRSRLIPFEFSDAQSYVLEFGNYTMRIISNGGIVVDGSNNPIVVTTIYPAADLPLLKWTQSADVMTFTHPSYPPQQLKRVSNTSWTFSAFAEVNGPFQTINIDKTVTVQANVVTGTVTLTASSALFTADMVGQLFYLEQMPNSSFPAWEVQKATNVNDIVHAGVSYYQALTSGTTGTVRPSALDGQEQDGNPGVTWQYLHSGFGIVLITGFTSSTVVTGTIQARLPDSIVSATVVKTIENVIPGDGVSVPVTIKITGHNFVTGATVTIAGVTGTVCNGTFTITVTDANNFTLNGNADNTAYTGGGTATNTHASTPTYKWAVQAWGGDQGYPGTTAYFQQRQIFARSNGQPQTVWMSRTAGFLDFGQSNPIADDDAITFTMNARKVNPIKHFVELSKLIMFTTDGPFSLDGGQDGVLTPSKITPKRQGASGVADIPPLVVGNNFALYVQQMGSQVRSIAYNFTQDAFVGLDLTALADHLFIGHQIKEWAFQEIPFNVAWVVRDDGALLGMTYVPEQEVTGWHRHDTTNGAFESVACIPEGTEHVVYVIVNRTIQGATKRYIERMSTRVFTGPSDYHFVDCGLIYNGAPATIFSGLSHLEGQTVRILADGATVADQVVTGGQITLQNAASVVHVGLPITADFETLEITSTSANLLDKSKIINHLSLTVQGTIGVNAGTDAAHLVQLKQRADEMYGQPVSPIDGTVTMSIPGNWQKQGRVFVRQTDPLPITILAVIPDVGVGGV